MIDSSRETPEDSSYRAKCRDFRNRTKMHQPIKVAHLSDIPSGGAAVAANRLARALTEHDELQVERWIFGRSKVAGLPIKQVALEKDRPKTFFERVLRIFSRTAAKHLQKRRQREALVTALAEFRPHILHLHNLHASALRHEDLAMIPPDVRLVWTMHDCWPLVPWAYRWKNESGNYEIQGAELRPQNEALAARRRLFAARKDALFVSPSHWLADEVKRNLGDRLRLEVIPNGVPTDIFAPTDKAKAKSDLGLNPSKTWIGLSAASFDCRKGADILMEALRLIQRNDLGILMWGNSRGIVAPENVSLFAAGYEADERRQALLYSACDLFVCPSRIDNFPNTVLESMACGTPVVGSSVGGIPEMVHPGETGWLYEPNTAEACAGSLRESLQSQATWTAYGQRCRETVEAQFTPGQQAARYASLYLEMLGLDPGTSKTSP